jgi:hypothetical protein
MPDAPPATVEDMFVQTASGIRTDDGTMTLLGLTPHTIYFSDRPERIVGHITTHRFLQWWSEGDDSFAVDPPNAVLAWGEPGEDAPEEAVVVISDPAVTQDGLRYHIGRHSRAPALLVHRHTGSGDLALQAGAADSRWTSRSSSPRSSILRGHLLRRVDRYRR